MPSELKPTEQALNPVDGCEVHRPFSTSYCAECRRLSGGVRPILYFARAEGYDRDALRAAVLMTDLPSMGDCRLVWINDGDLDAMVMRGQAKECNRG